MADSQKKVLIVDDVDLVRKFLKDIFTLHCVEVILANNGKEAVEISAKEDFGAILMDLDMPIMGGIEATRIIRQREKDGKKMHTPIFALSGRFAPSSRGECLSVDMDGFFAKPIAINEIFDAILPLVHQPCKTDTPPDSFHSKSRR